jgi:hypothetical protein
MCALPPLVGSNARCAPLPPPGALARLSRALAAAFFALYAAVAALLVRPLAAHERVHRTADDRNTILEAAPASAAPPPPHDHDDDPRPVVSFGGCGFLYPYQLGAAEFDTAHLRTAGHSAGFASCLTLAAGVPSSVHWHVLLAARARWSGRRLGPFLDATRAWMAPYTSALAPHEASVVAAAADGRFCIGYTRLALTRSWPPLRAGHAVKCCFRSVRELVYTITVSQRCMPFYRSPGWLHGAWGLDGAFSAQFTLPPGACAARCVTVSPTNPLADVAPCPPLPPSWFLTLPDAARWEALRARGYEDARAARAVLLRRGLMPRRHEQAEQQQPRRSPRTRAHAARTNA